MAFGLVILLLSSSLFLAGSLTLTSGFGLPGEIEESSYASPPGSAVGPLLQSPSAIIRWADELPTPLLLRTALARILNDHPSASAGKRAFWDRTGQQSVGTASDRLRSRQPKTSSAFDV